MHNSICDTDVFVCGGGPAGLAAAIAARLAGLDVTVVDCAQPPIDKACGEGIMPAGLIALQRLGVEIGPADGSVFVGIRFVDSAGAVDARFPQGQGLGVRRTVLHEALIRRASELGIPMHWGVRVSALSSNGVSVNGHTIRPRWLVGADGQQSQLRELAGLAPARTLRRRFGFRRHYRVPPWSPFVEVYWSDVGQMYITPVGDELCAALLTSRPCLRFDEALPFFPEVCSRLEGAQFARLKGAVTATSRLREVQRGGVALIGDASGSVDAITGEGMSLAFLQALALADAMRREDLPRYQQAHRRIARWPHVMAELMLAMDARPWFRHRVFRAFTADPSLFARLLAFHTGALSPAQFGVRGTLSLGWRVLTA